MSLRHLWLVVNEDDYGKFRIERVKALELIRKKHLNQMGFFQFEIIINVLVSSF